MDSNEKKEDMEEELDDEALQELVLEAQREALTKDSRKSK